MLTYEQSAVVACICALPSAGRMSRMDAFKRVLQGMPGLGRFGLKNYFEALVAQGLWDAPTAEKFGKLPDRPGAETFWRESAVSRCEMVSSPHDTIESLGEHAKGLHVMCCATYRIKMHSLHSLGLTAAAITEGTA